MPECADRIWPASWRARSISAPDWVWLGGRHADLGRGSGGMRWSPKNACVHTERSSGRGPGAELAGLARALAGQKRRKCHLADRARPGRRRRAGRLQSCPFQMNLPVMVCAELRSDKHK